MDEGPDKEYEEEHQIVSIHVGLSEDGYYEYWAEDVNEEVSSFVVLEGLAITLSHLLEMAEEQDLDIPEQLEGFSYEVEE